LTGVDQPMVISIKKRPNLRDLASRWSIPG